MKQGPDSTFAIKANAKTQCPKSSRFRLVKIMDRGRVIRPRVEYRILGEFLSKMPAILYLTALKPAKRARLTRSSFIAYLTSLGLSGGCEHRARIRTGDLRHYLYLNLR